jgi:hypothetical protein
MKTNGWLCWINPRGCCQFQVVIWKIKINLLPDGLELTAVHRLDLGTSGIFLLARDKETSSLLRQQFEKRRVHKVYEAVLSGTVNIEAGTIELPMKEDPENSLVQQVNWECGKPSVTRFHVMAKEGNYTRVEFLPLTGRTHQLRVHAADIRGLGIPILGDRLYGCRAAANRLHLHSRELSFDHPQLGSKLHLQAATPFWSRGRSPESRITSIWISTRLCSGNLKMLQTPTKSLTLEEFLKLPETEPASEYINGRIVQKPMPQGEHSALQTELSPAINSVVRVQKIARAFSELRCTFGGRSIIPDVSVFLWSRIPPKDNGEVANVFSIVPDWTIAILSPDQSQTKVTKNIWRCWFTVWKAKYAIHKNQCLQSFWILKLFISYPD